jgi:hypothetical protein
MLIRIVVWAVFGLLVLSMFSSSASAQTWKLPQGATVKDAGPRTYRFAVDYNTENTKGEIVHRERVTGEYTRGLPGGEVGWKNVAVATAEGATAPFGAAQKRDFMEGFRYRNDLESTMKPDFFKAFPPVAVSERNLVWDTGMIEHFGQDYFGHLKLNEPYHTGLNGDVKMPGVGTFRNRDIVLEWIGRSHRNGHDCALIKYQAFFNPLEIINSGITMKGRSDYWGEIWVSLDTRQIENGTLYENVTGEVKPAGQSSMQIINVFRIGTFEPVKP